MSALFQALFEQFGPTLTFEEAAKALKFKNVKSAYTARQRGIFPIRTIDLGGRLGCAVIDLSEFLNTGIPQKNSPSVPQSRRPGRPRKTERIKRSDSKQQSGLRPARIST